MTGRRFALLLFLGIVPLASAQTGAPKDDDLLGAMRDELNRSRTLRVANLESPYYTEYSVHAGESFQVSATLGALFESNQHQFRQAEVEVRVGSPKFDNTNFLLSGFQFGSRYRLGQMPLDNDYAVLRQYLWLATDRAYKSALEAIARKRAALKNFNVSEQPADFAPAKPAKVVLPLPKEPIDEEAWKEHVRALSAVFAEHREITDSAVSMQSVQGSFRFVNSEGTEVRVPETLIYVEVKSTALAPDGMSLRDAVVLHSHRLHGMPSEAEMRRAVADMANNLTALAHAPLGEPYSGPVLFEAPAAAQLFAEVLGRNLAPKRAPVSEPGRPLPVPDSELEGRLGSRILPEWMDIIDDPTRKEWRGRELLGSYPVDLEGVVPKPVKLVTKGVLTGFLLTRQPVRGFEGSNGRARLPGSFGARAATFGNLFIQVSERVSPAKLRKELLDLCRKRKKPYGIIVRKMDFPSSASAGEFRRLMARMAQGGDRAVSLPVLVYRLYPDGREELVRGLRFQGLSVRSLKDIIAASDESYVLNYLENGAPWALMGARRFVADSSVIAPSLLFEDVQLELLEGQLPKPPLAPPPPLRAVR